jgi:hypothetical protein
MGSAVELLGKRRGQMLDMEASGYVPYSSVSTRSIRSATAAPENFFFVFLS